MSKLIKSVSPETLQSWGVLPESQIEYYDGTILVVDDGEPDGGLATMAKFGCSVIFGVAVFTHAPLIGATMFAYAGYKALSTVRSMYGGNNALTSRIERDLGIETVPDGWVPMPQLPESAPIGNNTRLGAVDVQSQAVQTATRQTIALTGLSSIVLDPYQSRAFFGAQRTGKSYLAAVASREISNSLGCKIYHVNLASFGNEDAQYWQHATETLRGDLSSLDAYEAKDLVKDAIELIKRFYSQQNALLIVDEIAYIGSISNQHSKLLEPLLTLIADKITTLSSSGKKRQQAIWTIAPEFVAGSLTQDAKAVKKLKLCYVAAHPSKALDWNGQAISFDWELFRQIKANFEISEPSIVPNSDRVCFIAPNWMSVGELPKLGKSESVLVVSAPIEPEPIESTPTGDLLAEQVQREVAKMALQSEPVNDSDSQIKAIVAAIQNPEIQDTEGWVKLRDIQRTLDKEFSGIAAKEVESYCHTLAYIQRDRFEIRIKQGKGSPSKQIRVIS